MSKSAEFPHSTSGHLQPKGHKNSAKKKQSHSSAEFPNSAEKKIGSLQLPPLIFYGYENKIL